MWHLVAPKLTDAFTVVAADLRGYGESSKPPTTPDHEPYSKRAMARDMVDVMRQLGFESFRIAGHDRGGRCAYRLALDHPERVERLAVLDIVPTADMWRRADKELGLATWHWFFLAQPFDLPERILGADPGAYYFHEAQERFAPQALADYLAAIANRETIHAMCEDYRAGATYDDELDEADRDAGRRIRCPVLALWSARDGLEEWFDVLAVWRGWADEVTGRALACGHYLAEERPDEVAAELRAFFGGQ
jgi:haloacetate dehalogenase